MHFLCLEKGHIGWRETTFPGTTAASNPLVQHQAFRSGSLHGRLRYLPIKPYKNEKNIKRKFLVRKLKSKMPGCSDTLKRYIRIGTRFDENAVSLVGL